MECLIHSHAFNNVEMTRVAGVGVALRLEEVRRGGDQGGAEAARAPRGRCVAAPACTSSRNPLFAFLKAGKSMQKVSDTLVFIAP